MYDLNCANAALLFDLRWTDKSPTGPNNCFQISMQGIAAEGKGTSLLKLCAESAQDFTLWSGAIDQGINRKYTENGYENRPMPAYVPTGEDPISLSDPESDGEDRRRGGRGSPEPTGHPGEASGVRHRGKSDTASAHTIEPPEVPAPALTPSMAESTSSAPAPDLAPIVPISPTRPARPASTLPITDKPAQQQNQEWGFQFELRGLGACMAALFHVQLVLYVATQAVWWYYIVALVAACSFVLRCRRGIAPPPPPPEVVAPTVKSSSAFSKPSSPPKVPIVPPLPFPADLATTAADSIPTVAHLPKEPSSPSMGAQTPPPHDSGSEDDESDEGATEILPEDVPAPAMKMVGSTVTQLQGEPVPHQWGPLPGTGFEVRIGPDYRKNKKKAPSSPVICETIGVDLFSSPHKITHIFPRLQRPQKMKQEGGHSFIINVMLPSYAPSMWQKVWDGPGHSLVMYLWIPPELMTEVEAANSGHLGLLRRFIHANEEAQPNLIYDRMKMIGKIMNADEVELYSTERGLVSKYNAKPVLTRPQHQIYHGSNYTEVDVDVHTFGFIARKGLNGFLPRIAGMVLDVGFVIEGEDNNELPEVILGCFRANKLSLDEAVPWY
eukprot:NODE_631_length_2234_cov_76.005211_g601_i0.p1 GENE.NODE_631_length_2234_cov_76.005211_g601_i0~~NODE_631_length_2234_cov_76.005211_g601_i0.p1  ORF type:complete len:643 (-),score=101.77 NODE_631_length_2234_cov_76.005211_g601_i0:304-2133(-)